MAKSATLTAKPTPAAQARAEIESFLTGIEENMRKVAANRLAIEASAQRTSVLLDDAMKKLNGSK